MSNYYEVTYLKHSIFEDCKRTTEKVTKETLIALLENGMLTVTEARRDNTCK